MRNIRLVIRHEIASLVGKRSFWIMTFLFPLIIIGLNIGTQVVARNIGSDQGTAGGEGGAAGEAAGYVDQAGAITRLPPGMPAEVLRPFPDEAAAQAALESGAIARYYLIPPGWLDTGKVVVVDRDYNPLGSTASPGIIEFVLNYNLVGDERLASLVIDPTPQVQDHARGSQGGPDTSNPLSFFVPFAVLFIFFFLLTMSGGFMLQSVTKEKENLTAEVLLLSLRPRDLMLGKVLGLGIIALFQMAVWMGMGLLALDRARQMLEVAASFALPPGFFAWALLYFLLGYLLYASLLGALGALAPSMREGTQFTFAILLPLMIPLWVNVAFTEAPNGTLATVLSLFPLTAPTAMVTRLATGVVPVWQAAAGLAGLAVTAYLVVLIAARFFKAETLLSGSTVTLRRIAQQLRG